MKENKKLKKSSREKSSEENNEIMTESLFKIILAKILSLLFIGESVS